MKKWITLFTVLCFSLSVFAQFGPNTSNLTISTTGASNLKIRLAGKKYSLQDRSLTFQGLAPGNYTLSIFQLQPKAFGGGTEYVTVFDRTITLTSQKHMEVCVLRFGKVAWDEKFIERDNWNENFQNPEPDRDRWNSGGGGNGGNGGNWGNNNYREPVDPNQFARIRDMIKKEAFDDNKNSTARAIMKNNWFTAEQLKTIAGFFTFDNGRLQFAKFAYDYCTDPGNFFILGDTFVFDSNKQELMKFIAGK
ncbi:MAG: DUF4476 domain-containing protein [Bacteroidetes bacterium]|nr:DUF4476 domain-containing protein [Bacteroidota bacterium]